MAVSEESMEKNYPAVLHPSATAPETGPPQKEESPSEPLGEIFIGVFVLAALILALLNWFI